MSDDDDDWVDRLDPHARQRFEWMNGRITELTDDWRDAVVEKNAEIERLKGELERLEDILSPEAMRGDQTIDDAYDVVFRALASLEESQP